MKKFIIITCISIIIINIIGFNMKKFHWNHNKYVFKCILIHIPFTPKNRDLVLIYDHEFTEQEKLRRADSLGRILRKIEKEK